MIPDRKDFRLTKKENPAGISLELRGESSSPWDGGTLEMGHSCFDTETASALWPGRIEIGGREFLGKTGERRDLPVFSGPS